MFKVRTKLPKSVLDPVVVETVMYKLVISLF